jgi:type IV pilus assembly protein PilN
MTVNGYAEDNDQVAAFMRNIDASKIFTEPQLNIISKSKLGSEEVGQFTLQMNIRKPTAADKSAQTTGTQEAQP